METRPPNTVDAYHNDVKVWISNISLAAGELRFIDSLMQSYIFEPNTPNLFERLEQFKSQIFKIKTLLTKIQKQLSKHNLELSSMMECDTVDCDIFFQEKHLLIREEYRQFVKSYNKTKVEIFEYCGSILKKKKAHKY